LITHNSELFKDDEEVYIKTDLLLSSLPKHSHFTITCVQSLVTTTSGNIQKNTITSLPQNKITIYIKFDNKPIKLDVQFFEKDYIVHNEFVEFEFQFSQEQKVSVPVIFTGKEKYNALYKKLNQTITNCKFTITQKNGDIILTPTELGTETLFCFGTKTEELNAQDIVFSCNGNHIVIPKELVLYFLNKEVYVFVLVKSDFQKSIKNKYYKSSISLPYTVKDVPLVPQKIEDFCDPIGTKLDPLKWFINAENFLPISIEQILNS